MLYLLCVESVDCVISLGVSFYGFFEVLHVPMSRMIVNAEGRVLSPCFLLEY